jgi:hypothetical protein
MIPPPKPTIGRIVHYRTDGRNGLVYDLPAIITCTEATHPGAYPDGQANGLPVPIGDFVHLTVFSPGGFGTTVRSGIKPENDAEFVGAHTITPGSGTYVEWNVPFTKESEELIPARSWRWPVRD